MYSTTHENEACVNKYVYVVALFKDSALHFSRIAKNTINDTENAKGGIKPKKMKMKKMEK